MQNYLYLIVLNLDLGISLVFWCMMIVCFVHYRVGHKKRSQILMADKNIAFSYGLLKIVLYVIVITQLLHAAIMGGFVYRENG